MMQMQMKLGMRCNGGDKVVCLLTLLPWPFHRKSCRKSTCMPSVGRSGPHSKEQEGTGVPMCPGHRYGNILLSIISTLDIDTLLPDTFGMRSQNQTAQLPHVHNPDMAMY
jgi:hypothetical protein